jgi:hypothetical protein
MKLQKGTSMSSAITIGSSEHVIKAAHQVILAILKEPCGDNVKQTALETLCKISSVNGASISNCNFEMK